MQTYCQAVSVLIVINSFNKDLFVTVKIIEWNKKVMRSAKLYFTTYEYIGWLINLRNSLVPKVSVY